MDVFDLRGNLVSDYRDYTRSFIKIRDPWIKGFVDDFLGAEGFWPEPLLQLNPTFRSGGTIDDLVDEGILHPECSRLFRIDKSETDHRSRQLLLHRHQRDAILKAKEGRSYLLTTGTGSGKTVRAYIRQAAGPHHSDLDDAKILKATPKEGRPLRAVRASFGAGIANAYTHTDGPAPALRGKTCACRAPQRHSPLGSVRATERRRTRLPQLQDRGPQGAPDPPLRR